ncbi:MAG: LacI family DNA-binding transcriptional regulator [Propionivibrio sp.]|jgi:LacI family transcriptional regulator|nr:LacI family DNA-binding transcriptional regulator [Propionivibrio sp.]MBP6711435.1 LacI family DNA-binding transcriptional regulator [Propionivibrio sp.]MBP7523557.1 LacI family DNA-binding transcriptional regulator [Propionivibrio sp.]
MSTPTTTIAEIARHAGVGTATVDRVLNGRPGVNAETVQKVMQAISALGEPVVQRGRPRLRDNFRFAYVLPAGASQFYDQVERQIALIAGDFRHKHTTEVTYRFNADDPAEFAASLAQVSDCDGIVLLAPDLPAIKLAINEQVRNGVHVVTLFSDVAGSMREVFVGADNRAAGRTAGLLLARMAHHAHDTLLLLSQATRMSAEIERRIGFTQVVEERFSHLQVQRAPDLPAADEGVYQSLRSFLHNEIDPGRLAGIYSVGTGTAGIVRVLDELGLEHLPGLVAHDFTELHQSLLISGELSYVLHQDIYYCVLTAARVLRGLCENVRGALSVVQPRVEILTAENLH